MTWLGLRSQGSDSFAHVTYSRFDRVWLVSRAEGFFAHGAQGGDGESAARAAAESTLKTVVPVINNAADAADQGFDKSFPGLYASRITSCSITGPAWTVCLCSERGRLRV